MKGPCITILSVFVTAHAIACSCGPKPSVSEALQRSAFVFSGKVTKAELVTSDDLLPTEAEYTFRVERYWKGEVSPYMSVRSRVDDAACGYPFRVGKSYIVYAYMENGTNRTDVCTRTRRVDGTEYSETDALGQSLLVYSDNGQLIRNVENPEILILREDGLRAFGREIADDDVVAELERRKYRAKVDWITLAVEGNWLDAEREIRLTRKLSAVGFERVQLIRRKSPTKKSTEPTGARERAPAVP